MLGILSITGEIRKMDIFRYLFMPQILPRIADFYRSGFSHLAFIIALVYRGVRILPADHRIFSRARSSHLSIREVMGTAAAELQFNRKNIDKIAIYILILLGIVLLIGQVFLTLGYFMIHPAFAQTLPTNYGEFFAAPNYDQDIAYRMLFSVFGVPELFYPGGTRNEFHIALHSLFQLYSVGLLVIAVIIACYYMFAVVVETAQTGVPFGKRYNHVWTPIRLIVGLGLLIPVGYGLNSAQWITLYSAKFGSDFATRGWVLFNQTMTDAYLDDPNERVGRPQMPDLTDLAAFIMTAQTCKFAYESYYNANGNVKNILAYLVKTEGNTATQVNFTGQSFEDATEFYNHGDILIRFGEYDTELHTGQLGAVYSYCGDLVIAASDTSEPGSVLIQQAYYELVRDMWNHTGGYVPLWIHARNFVRRGIIIDPPRVPDAPKPGPAFKRNIADTIRNDIEPEIQEAVEAQAQSPTWTKDNDMIATQGWAGAGMWYNKIAQINGSLVQAVMNVPQVRRMPAVMEYMRVRQLQQNEEVPQVFSPNLADGKKMEFDDEQQKNIGEILSTVYSYWSKEDTDQSTEGSQTKSTYNVFIDTINLVFGTRGLFNMCENTDVHPLAQLSILGKGLVDSSIRNLAMGMGFGVAASMPISFLGIAAGAASNMLLAVASITITMGFLLFYVVPFMPFLYFFFAVGGWIKGLFEAMVGVPLWALAHLKIDGEGLPGDAALDGYYLILEIFLRPILIVFGLLASAVIFGAMVKVLNEIFSLVVANLSGHDETFTQLCGRLGGGGGGGTAVEVFRGPIDELFFTIIYAIIVYMIGMSCFKLIDLVPNNLMRYMGARVQTFNDVQSSPAEGLMFRLSAGGHVISGQVMGIGRNAAGAAKGGIQAAAEFATPSSKGGE